MLPLASNIGILGGGQLGRMLSLAAANLGYNAHIYSPDSACPASHVTPFVTIGTYDDKGLLKEFASKVDVVTLEFENIPVSALEYIAELVPVYPSAKALYIAQNRIREKTFCTTHDISVVPFWEIYSQDDLADALSVCDGPSILKTVEFGYDGKGQMMLEKGANPEIVWQEAGVNVAVLESFIPFTKEVSILIARSVTGEVSVFPLGENVHKQGILDHTTVPAQVTNAIAEKAEMVARRLVDALDYIGILAIEFFIDEQDQLLVNEIAPRPHNSGHWTMDGCVTSQFEQTIRAVAGLPLGSVDILGKTVMQNLIGEELNDWQSWLEEPHAKLHLYGKTDIREGRKMGHVNILQVGNRF